MSLDKKLNSKTYRFFDYLFGLVVVNLMTIILSIFIITLLPAVTACYQTISDFKEVGPSKVFRMYFSNFKKHLEKSFIIGLFIIIILVIASFSMLFYGRHFDPNSFVGQAGYWIMLVVLLLLVLFSLHLPLVMINFQSFGIMDTIRISIFICFRYFISSLIILGLNIIIVIGVLALPIWVVIGISLPVFLSIKLTDATYYYLRKIDLEKIIQRAKEIEDEEDDSRD